MTSVAINTDGTKRHFYGRNTNTRSAGIYRPKADDFLGSFFAVLNRWRSETRFLSDPAAITDHPSFKALVENAGKVLPLIKMELTREPSLLIWVLEDHFGHAPYSPGDEGDIAKQTNRWISFLDDVE